MDYIELDYRGIESNCQSHNGYTTFFPATGEQILVSGPIKEYERLLTKNVFFRIHQSYIVNIEHVDLYHKEGYLLLKTGVQLPVSIRKRDEVVKYLISQ